MRVLFLPVFHRGVDLQRIAFHAKAPALVEILIDPHDLVAHDAFADRDKERTFIDSIVNGPAHNQIADGVETALSCMLGRMAGYQRREVTWEDLRDFGETYELNMNLDQFA